MPIQILLTLGLLAALVYASVQRVMPRVILWAFAGLISLGVYFVWMPDHTTVVAQWLGVARGTDLLIYLWIVLTLIVGLNLHLKIQSAREEITELARALALASAKEPARGPGERKQARGSPGIPGAEQQDQDLPPDPGLERVDVTPGTSG